MNKIKLVFVGGNPAGVAVLKSAIGNSNCEILGVVPNKSDCSNGHRGSIRDEATSKGVALLSIEGLRDITGIDLLLSVHSEIIIKEPFLSLPKYGLNVHFALLPRHRGMFPLGHAILEGDEYTGVTVHRMNAGIDTGPILYQEKFPISPSDTHHTLYTECTNRAIRLTNLVIGELASGKELNFREQVGEPSYHGRNSYPPSEISLSSGPDSIKRHIRALTSPRYKHPYILIGGTKFEITPETR